MAVPPSKRLAGLAGLRVYGTVMAWGAASGGCHPSRRGSTVVFPMCRTGTLSWVMAVMRSSLHGDTRDASCDEPAPRNFQWRVGC